ncbi:hypothetical protein F2Q68_00006598 [Brassica cretica]|uniref:DUF223 domain-containing protein n=1 Tax=Brassica cretica TaxID=69181 RepID=A0A8S9JB26_BRACR|nr:hypothetical protein F2Q68_00006598 [Brassica cretica]
MKSNGKAIVSHDPIVKKPNGKDAVSSTVLDQPTGKNAVSSAKVHKVMPAVSSAVPIQPSGKTAVSSVKVDKVRSSAKVDKVLFFRDVSFGIQEGELRFRLIHFWEARNVLTKTLIGLEMLLIDEQGSVIQGFIPSARIDTYLPHMKAGSVYRLNKCFGSNSKVMYRVAEPRVVISFTSNSVLSDLEDSRVNFPDDRFRFHSYEEFEAACDLKGDLYGALALASMSSSRVFLDFDVQPTRDYVTWLDSNLDVANRVDAKVVTKTETMTIGELFSYIKQEAAKSNGKAIVSHDPIVKKSNSKDAVSSTVLDQPTGKNAVSSAKVHKVMPAVSSVRSSAKVDKVLFFRDVSFGIEEGELRFRLIHFWEPRNVLTKTLIGLEMLLIDEQGTVIQGFIPSARNDTYLPHMKAGSVYRLNKCFGSNSKVMYRVAEPRVVISFTSMSSLILRTVGLISLMIGSVSIVTKSLRQHVTSKVIFTVRSHRLHIDFDNCLI